MKAPSIGRVPTPRTLRAAGTTVSLAMLIGGLAYSESRADPSPHARATRLAGALSVTDSRADRAVLTGSKMLPGDSVTGTVSIADSGAEPGLFELSEGELSDTPGSNGNALSNDLRLVVETLGDRPTVLYDGALGDLGIVPVGELSPGQARTFRFTVRRPRAQQADSDRGASTDVDFEWAATREQSGRCANEIIGSSRNDALSGSREGDTIEGGPGDDVITGGAGQDCLRGESGDDVIDARDGEADQIDCGAGTDTVLADPQDTTVGCERRIG